MDNWKNTLELLDNKINQCRQKRRLAMINILALHKEQMAILMAASSDTTINRKRWEFPRSNTFWETDCTLFNDEQFKNHFRITRSSFTTLCTMLEGLKQKNSNMHKAISLEERVAVALYALGSSAKYQSISNLFGIEKSTVRRIVLEFCESVWNALKPQYLNAFPLTRASIEENVKGFENIGFPQCLGAISCCHIEINPRKANAVDYYNCEGWYSIILLALVGARCRFMYVNVGAPGCCSDSTVYETSKLKKHLSRCDLLHEMSKKICNVDIPILVLGDSAFRFSSNLMKPYPSKIKKNVQQKNFNQALSKSRRVVENAFGDLKARFCRIGKGRNNQLDNATKIIKACCVLHNFLNENNDNLNEEWLRAQTQADKYREQPNDYAILNDQIAGPEEIRHALALNFTSSPVGDDDEHSDGDGNDFDGKHVEDINDGDGTSAGLDVNGDSKFEEFMELIASSSSI